MELWRMGIEKTGDIVEYYSEDPIQFGDVCIAWGPRTAAHAHQKALHHLIMECGFLGDRLDNFYVGWSALNGFGKPAIATRPGAGEPWYDMLQPLPRRGTHKRIVIMGQVAKDASLIPLEASDNDRPIVYRSFLYKVARFFESLGLEVGFRGHPSDPAWTNYVKPPVRNFDDEGWSMGQVLEWADVAFAFSSNSLVEAFMAGVDVIPAHPTSLCWDIRSHIGVQRYLNHKERKTWLDHVASSQWSFESIASGEAWQYIREGFARIAKS